MVVSVEYRTRVQLISRQLVPWGRYDTLMAESIIREIFNWISRFTWFVNPTVTPWLSIGLLQKAPTDTTGNQGLYFSPVFPHSLFSASTVHLHVFLFFTASQNCNIVLVSPLRLGLCAEFDLSTAQSVITKETFYLNRSIFILFQVLEVFFWNL